LHQAFRKRIPFFFNAPGRRKTGFVLPISAYTGIGSGRAAAASKSARPAGSEPVKATALVRG